MHPIRRFVGRGTLALGIGAALALAVAVQAGQAAHLNDAPSSHLAASAQVGQTSMHLQFTLSSPSPACSAAMGRLEAAVGSDVAEDKTERSTNATDTETGADQAEDASERAAFKPLISAVVAACATSFQGHKAPVVAKSPACAAALQALRTAFAQDRAEAQAEFASGTEGTAADQAEDKTEIAHLQSLWSAVKSACATGTTTSGGTASTFSTWWWHR